MCANAISQLNLKHVYFGCKNERFGGCGSVDNTIFDVPFTENFENSSDRAVYLLKAFYCNENPNAPEEKRKQKDYEKRREKLSKSLVKNGS